MKKMILLLGFIVIVFFSSCRLPGLFTGYMGYDPSYSFKNICLLNNDDTVIVAGAEGNCHEFKAVAVDSSYCECENLFHINCNKKTFDYELYFATNTQILPSIIVKNIVVTACYDTLPCQVYLCCLHRYKYRNSQYENLGRKDTLPFVINYVDSLKYGSKVGLLMKVFLNRKHGKINDLQIDCSLEIDGNPVEVRHYYRRYFLVDHRDWGTLLYWNYRCKCKDLHPKKSKK